MKGLTAAIASHSTLLWCHINVLGEYDLSDNKLKDVFNLKPRGLAA
jgi:hypothetical protein